MRPPFGCAQPVRACCFAAIAGIATLLGACADLKALHDPGPYQAFLEPADDQLLVPGRRIGRIVLGMPLKEALAILGEPSESRQQQTGSSYLYQKRGIEQFAVVVDESTQKLVRARTALAHTPDGVRIGSSAATAKAVFGAPQRLDSRGAQSSYYCYDRGIGVLVEYGQVVELEVLPKDSCG